MKKLVFILLLFASSVSYACDICGCGVGSYYVGILPNFKKRFIGLRYQQKGLLTHISANGNRSYLTSDEWYRSVELWGAFNIGNRFRIQYQLPYHFMQRTNQGATGTKQGLGDIAVMGFYKLFNLEQTISNKRLIQSFWIGGGLKLPTGAYNPDELNLANQQLNSFQLGTASMDFTLQGSYDIRLNDLGLNTTASFKANSFNKYHYKYGNKAMIHALAYHKFSIKQLLTVTPNLGFQYENAELDTKNKSTAVEESGGSVSMGTLGVETSFKKCTFGFNYQTPLAQNLAGNRVRAKERAMVHISYSF